MADKKDDDLLSRWMNRSQAEITASDVTPESREIVQKGVTPDVSGEAPLAPNRRFMPPLLSGRLADFLSTQQPRHIHGDGESMTSKDVDFEIKDVQTRAVVAMSIILTSHLTRFGATTLSEASLNQVREQIMRTFSAHDAVRIEVEAYDLLNWFAGVMNESWAMSTSVTSLSSPSQCMQNHVAMIERAITDKRDLEMRYYTGTRGEFSTRRISPIKIEAEKYLIAYCHSRKEERKFRLTRILSLNWIDSMLPSPPSVSELPVSIENDESLPNIPSSNVTITSAPVASNAVSQTHSRLTAPEPVQPDVVASDPVLCDDEDDLREITAEGSENASPTLQPGSVSDSASVAVVNVSAGWIPESQIEAYRRDKLKNAAVQATLPGIAAVHEPPKSQDIASKPEKSKPKKPTTGFLPGFE